MGSPDANDPGLLTPAQTTLLTDQYELAMASSYLGRGMNEPAVFELFVRHLPPRRRWLLAAGLGPALAMVQAMEFGEEELAYARSLGFGRGFLEYLARFRFSGDIDAMPEGTIVFAGEPLVRVTRRAGGGAAAGDAAAEPDQLPDDGGDQGGADRARGGRGRAGGRSGWWTSRRGATTAPTRR